MRTLIIIATAALLTGCAAGPIPDNIPPAPPKRLGQPITAPSTETEEPVQEGFGGDGFGGVTPTIEVEAPAEEVEEEADESEDAESDDEAAKPAKAPAQLAKPAGADSPQQPQ